MHMSAKEDAFPLSIRGIMLGLRSQRIPMPKQITTIQKCAWGFAALFLGVYLLDYVPGIMDANGLMFGLFHMTRIVDLGHLAAGALGIIGALSGPKGARSV